MFTHEVISYNKTLPIKLFFQRIGDVAKHWHQSLELLFVLRGTAVIGVESEIHTLTEGDIILINPQQIHETHGDDCIIAMLQIRLSMFHAPGVSEQLRFHCNSSLYQNKERFSNLIRLFAQLIQINSGTATEDRTSLLTISYAYQMMHELMLNFHAPEHSVKAHSTESLTRLKHITSYLEDHYMENITLKSMAEQEYLSSSYLSHFFEKNMNMTFSSYLTSVRLRHALRELMGTDHFIEDIALNNGFPNSRAFVAAFRKQYRMLPSQYRTDNQAQHDDSAILEDSKRNNYLELKKDDFLSILNQYLDKNSAAPQKPELWHSTGCQRISVKDEGTPLIHTCRVFTSVGRAGDLLREDIRNMLRTLQTEIGYHYIKFHGILDDAMMLYQEDSKGTPRLSFTYVDMAIDFLLSIGLRPLIQLSFMPKGLALRPNQEMFANPVIISPPKDEQKWCFLVEGLTRHFLERYGKKEVEGWLFSFWNETLTETPFTMAEPDTVYRIYELSYRSVKKYSPRLRFGNPSLLTIEFPNADFTNFLNFCEKHECMPDFHVLHFYPISQNQAASFGQVKREEFMNLKAGDITLSQDPDRMKKFIDSYREYAKEFENTPAYLTEWCSTSSHRDWLNDTCFRSAYILKNVLENYDRLDSFGNWTLTDFIEELQAEDTLFHGGMGIFTRNGIKKPAYYAFAFLSRLKDTLLCRGEGYFVTRDENGSITALLYNYNHFSSLYAQGILFDGSPDSRYEVFGETHSMDVEFILEGLTNGRCHMTERIVNRSYGSCYDEWMRMGAEPLTSQDEVELLKSRSVPMLQKSSFWVKDGRMSYFAHLKPHEIRAVEIWVE